MLSVPEKITGISHPQIASMYLKHEESGAKPEDVLIIETNYEQDEMNYEDFDSYLMDLLSDLNDLQRQAEKKVGKFDRVDIRH